MNDNELDIIRVLKTFICNIHIILSVAIVLGAGFFTISKVSAVPTYETSTIIMTEKSSNDSINATYANLSKSNLLVSKVKNKLGLEMSYEEFTNKVTVEPISNTRMINIVVKDTIPKRATDIANQTAIELKSAIGKLNKNRVIIVDKARLPKKNINQNSKKNGAIGFVLGFLIGTLILLVKDITDTRIKSADEIKEYYDIPLIGIVPNKAKGE